MRLNLTIVASLTLLAAACDPDDKCVADCEQDDSTSEQPTAGDDATETADSGSPSCQATEAEADAWVQANRACTYVTDCTQLDAICYQGDERGTCGSIAVSRDADATQWTALHDELTTCGECGAAACGSEVGCSDAGECVSLGPTQDICPEVEEDIGDFIGSNRACTVDEDCQLVFANCYEGPERACDSIGLNTAADLGTFEALHERLSLCVEACGGPDCGASVSCSPQGQCVATFP